MPTQTFMRLHPDKQERLVRAAIAVFLEKGFHQARVEDVSALAGIAKGSIYQYFEDKKALFTYCAQWGLTLFMEKLTALSPADDMDIFSYFRDAQPKAQVMGEEPELVAFLQRMGQEPGLWDRPLLDALYQVSYGYIDQLIDNSLRKGLLRADIPREILREYFIGVTERFETRWMARYFTSPEGMLSPSSSEAIQTELEQMLLLLKNGMGC